MNADTDQCGLVAKRRLPGDFHSRPPIFSGTAATRHAPDYAGNIACIPAIGKVLRARGKTSTALSPNKKNPVSGCED
jgi:hypothetical protein